MNNHPSKRLFDLSPQQTLLIANAHPDDFEMFHSATAELAQQQDINVAVAIATRGEATTLNFAKDNWPPNTPITEIRKAEAENAFAEQKIKPENQVQFELPDGKLHKLANRWRLSWKIARAILAHNVSAIVTPGEEGVDHHADHISVHRSAIFAARLLGVVGKRVAVWASSSEESCDAAVDVDTKRKKMLLQMHASQFPDQKLEALDVYEQQLRHERYRRVL